MENRELFEEMVAWLKEHHSAEELMPPASFAGSPKMWYYEVALYDKDLPKKFMRPVIDKVSERPKRELTSSWDDEYIEIEVPNSGLFGTPVEYKRVKKDAYYALFQNDAEMGG